MDGKTTLDVVIRFYVCVYVLLGLSMGQVMALNLMFMISMLMLSLSIISVIIVVVCVFINTYVCMYKRMRKYKMVKNIVNVY